MRLRWFLLPLLFCSAARAGTADTALLLQVAHNWLGEGNRWAFTQLVREYDGDQLKQTRVERYDPSQSDLSRWRLVSIDGRRATAEEWREWSGRKNKKHRRAATAVEEHFDFAAARVEEETAEFVRYDLPLRNHAEWLFPVNKVELRVTINRRGPALEQVQARIAEPFRVALGLRRVLDIDLDLQMEAPAALSPADAKPSGTAHAVIGKPGGRVEYFWSGFQRVTPHPAAAENGALAEAL